MQVEKRKVRPQGESRAAGVFSACWSSKGSRDRSRRRRSSKTSGRNILQAFHSSPSKEKPRGWAMVIGKSLWWHIAFIGGRLNDFLSWISFSHAHKSPRRPTQTDQRTCPSFPKRLKWSAGQAVSGCALWIKGQERSYWTPQCYVT